MLQKFINLRTSVLFYSTIKNLNVLQIYKTKPTGTNIQTQGWIKSIRKMKETLFFDVNDGSCSKNLQILISSDKNVPGLLTGASIVVDGILNISPKGQLELNAENIKVEGECLINDGYPFAPRKSYAAEYVRQYLHFRPRTKKFSSLLRVRHQAQLAMHEHFNNEGYTYIHTPILTSNDCEGAGEVFKVLPDSEETLKGMIKPGGAPEEAYFNSKVFLSVSGQLHLEAASHGLSKVYTFGPTFRAENSKSRLHLSEFYMLEAECAFLNKIEQVADVIEKLIKTVTIKVTDINSEDIEKCREQQITYCFDKNFIIMNYDEASLILERNEGRYKGNFLKEKGLSKEHELFLVKYCGEIPTFVINWPKVLKPFYMKSCPDDKTQVAALDLLVPMVGELAGGSLREDNYNRLKEKLPTETPDLQWYLDIRRFGSVPTGGFGLGFERYLQFILGINNIKDTIPFPRWPHNCNL